MSLLQANLAINPASLLPGSARRIPGAVSVTPGVGSLPSHSEGTQVTAASSQELGVSFDSPAQAQTLQTAIKVGYIVIVFSVLLESLQLET